MKGAKALAMPVRFGQHMEVEPTNRLEISWKTYSQGSFWFGATFDIYNPL
jgi:hypothetical protein